MEPPREHDTVPVTPKQPHRRKPLAAVEAEAEGPEVVPSTGTSPAALAGAQVAGREEAPPAAPAGQSVAPAVLSVKEEVQEGTGDEDMDRDVENWAFEDEVPMSESMMEARDEPHSPSAEGMPVRVVTKAETDAQADAASLQAASEMGSTEPSGSAGSKPSHGLSMLDWLTDDGDGWWHGGSKAVLWVVMVMAIVVQWRGREQWWCRKVEFWKAGFNLEGNVAGSLVGPAFYEQLLMDDFLWQELAVHDCACEFRLYTDGSSNRGRAGWGVCWLAYPTREWPMQFVRSMCNHHGTALLPNQSVCVGCFCGPVMARATLMNGPDHEARVTRGEVAELSPLPYFWEAEGQGNDSAELSGLVAAARIVEFIGVVGRRMRRLLPALHIIPDSQSARDLFTLNAKA